jgi:energy-coupling factor transporter ATP-binding protein EcfA2
MAVSFAKAIKYESKGRVALVGPAGSGKSFTMLTLARLLAGPEGKIAAIDTEQGSLSKYADLFEFDVAPLKTFSPDSFMEALQAAEQGGYAVFCCDSLSHFWMGKDGALEFVDNAAKRSSSRDGMSGWKEFRPYEREMIDAMVGSSCHVICTMRTKTDYQETTDASGKKKRVKVGLAPVQRDGLEYEFDLVGLMDDDNTFIVDKTRCSALNGKTINKPAAKDFLPFKTWLAGATPAPTQNGAPKNFRKGNIINWAVREAVIGKTASGNEYASIIYEGQPPVPGKRTSCWHKNLFDILRTANGKVCQFEIEETDKFLNIQTILAIGDQEYRDGKPFNPDAEPDMASTTANPEITDSDLPASLFEGQHAI